MADPFATVTPGQPLEINAEAFNLMLQNAKAQQNRVRGAHGVAHTFPRPTPDRVLIYNGSGSNLGQHTVVHLDVPAFIPDATYSEEFPDRMTWAIQTPTGMSGILGVTERRIWSGGCGMAIVNGIAEGFVNVTDASHEYATTPFGTPTSQWTSTGERTPQKIVWKESGTGTFKRCFVFMNYTEQEIEYDSFDLIADLNITTAATLTPLGNLTRLSDGATVSAITFPSDGIWEVNATLTGTATCAASSSGAASPVGLTGHLYDGTGAALLTPPALVKGGIIAGASATDAVGNYTARGSLTLTGYFLVVAVGGVRQASLDAALQLTTGTGAANAQVHAGLPYASFAHPATTIIIRKL